MVGVDFYACALSSKQEWKSWNGEVNEEDAAGEDDGPYIDSLELLLTRDVGWHQETSVFYPPVLNEWGNLQSLLTCA